MKTIAAPTVKSMNFDELCATFGNQVISDPVVGQRHHMAQNAAGRKHIQHSDNPTTQAVLQAVSYTGKAAPKKKQEKLTLIDGYHRMAHWMDSGFCPFEEVLVIIHTLHVETAAERIEKTEALASTIDSKKAAKANQDRWCAAVRDAGLKNPVSSAYAVGSRANSFFKRALGDAKSPMLKLIAQAESDLDAHIAMDQLYAIVESELNAQSAGRFFHAGVAISLFNQFRLMSSGDLAIALEQVINVITKLGLKKRSPAFAMMVLSDFGNAFYEKLIELGSDVVNHELRSLGNREHFYDVVAGILKPVAGQLNPKVTMLFPSKRKAK